MLKWFIGEFEAVLMLVVCELDGRGEEISEEASPEETDEVTSPKSSSRHCFVALGQSFLC